MQFAARSCRENSKEECRGAGTNMWMLAGVFRMKCSRNYSQSIFQIFEWKKFCVTVEDLSAAFIEYLFVVESPLHPNSINLLF